LRVANTRATAEVKRLRELLAERDRTVETQQLEIERLKIQLAQLRRWRFGRSSEQLELAITQLEMTLEALTAVTPQPTQTPVDPAPVRAPTRHRPARRALPAHLPRETLIHQADEVIQGCRCAACGGTLRRLGEDVAEVLELIPPPSKWSATFVRSTPAVVAYGSCSPLRLHVQSSAVWRGRRCWRM
jgi:transposase